MVQAIILGVACCGLYGLFLFVRGLVRLVKLGEMKMFGWTLGLFLLGGLLVAAGLLTKEENMNIWIALPVVIIAVLLLCAGYFLESYLRAEQRRRTDGKGKTFPARPKHWLRTCLLLLGAGLALWLGGLLWGYGGNGTVQTILLCACMFLLARSLTALWKYRGF